MMKRLGLKLAIAMFSLAALYGQTTAQSKAELVAVGGVVEVQRNNAWAQTAPGEQLNFGDRVRTGMFSSAALELEPGKVITLADRTEIQVGESNGAPTVQLESGNMKVFSTADIQVAAKDTLLQSVERPLDMLVGLEGDRLNVTVLSGAVRNGSITIRAAPDSNVRTYTANSRSLYRGYSAPYPSFYIYPYFMYGNPGNGGIVPPTVLNPPIQIRPNR